MMTFDIFKKQKDIFLDADEANMIHRATMTTSSILTAFEYLLGYFVSSHHIISSGVPYRNRECRVINKE